jgi:nucleotide-binding universal stress UspA family protein
MAQTQAKILVPIGFSQQSLLALDEAIIFAKQMNASITLLTVFGDGSLAKALGTDARGKALQEIAEQRLSEVAKEYTDKTGLSYDTKVAEGTVYEQIARIVEEIDADLVVMGTNGKPQNLRKRFIGSNAYRTVSLVKPPVITIKGMRKIEKIKTIIFPLVLDRRSKEKTGHALTYARMFGAKIKVVSVLKEKSEKKSLLANLKQVEKFINDAGVECSSELLSPTEKGIVRNTLNYAYDNGGDLIIITEDNHDRDVTDYFLGNDVQAMVYHSEIPVMCITPSEVRYEAMWESF